MAKVSSALKRITKNEITVVFTQHHRKSGAHQSEPSQDMRGSSEILACTDCHIAVKRKREENIITITQTKLRQDTEVKPFRLEIVNTNDEVSFRFEGSPEQRQGKSTNVRLAVIKALKEISAPPYKKELYEAVKNAGVDIGEYSTFKNVITEMLKMGEIRQEKGYKNKTYFHLQTGKIS
jgi:Fe2+ or Zn2+ uptake regulation protein